MFRGNERKQRKRINMQSQTEVDKEDLYLLKINCKGKRTVGKANKRLNVEKIMFKKLKI